MTPISDADAMSLSAGHIVWQGARATDTAPSGTPTIPPYTRPSASCEAMPKVPTATAIASSKLLLAAVNDWVAASS